jgi:NADH dehydrogenase (ubiquinone) Fe-S protein 8
VSSAATFTTSARLHATNNGSPPSGFRLPPPTKWNEQKESTFDRAGNYFLLTEMFRGMYVVLEQFFRPPYVHIVPPFKSRRVVANVIRRVVEKQR